MKSSIMPACTRMLVPALLASLAVPCAPAAAQDAASEGIAICRFNGADPETNVRFLAPGQMFKAEEYIAANKLNIQLEFIGGEYDDGNFSETIARVTPGHVAFDMGKPDFTDMGGLFLYDKNVKDRGDGGVYGDALAHFAPKASLYTCEVISPEKVCVSKKVNQFHMPCEG